MTPFRFAKTRAEFSLIMAMLGLPGSDQQSEAELNSAVQDMLAMYRELPS